MDPLRSDRKMIRPLTHIGLESLQLPFGIFATEESASLAIQIGVVRPPR